jgi:hypothetical protein
VQKKERDKMNLKKKKEGDSLLYSQIPREGVHALPQGCLWEGGGLCGSTRVDHKAKGEGRLCGQGPLLWFLWKGMGKTG